MNRPAQCARAARENLILIGEVMKTKSILITFVAVVFSGVPAFAACPSADLTGDCKVNFDDFAIMASQWLDAGEPLPVLNGMTWVSINDNGSGMKDEDGNPIDKGGFIGEMSKYETTNAQYCEFLNAALATGDITVNESYIDGASGSYSGQNYYNLAGAGFTYNGATNGGAARINWTGSSFTVDSGFENHPVTYVSWYGSAALASYYGWRLPTEWEWQAVADYNGSFTYGCGTTINNSKANYYGSTHPYGTTAVGAFGTYGYGMCDMAGNAGEWTSTFSGSYRVIRGGSWTYNDYYCTVSNRNYSHPNYTFSYVGFRVCR